MDKKRALITGTTGQDGSYLAELLLNKNYEIHGILRRVAYENFDERFSRIKYILPDIHLHYASLENYASICKVVLDVVPNECYHLAAQSDVAVSFEDEFSTMKINVEGTHNLLSALQMCQKNCKFYFATSSEMFGITKKQKQNENTLFNPQSIYGISKVAGFNITKYYREKHKMFACNGICFNHESPRRGSNFVTRKISDGVARIKLGLQQKISLGNLYSARDWGHAKDYVRAMWLMLQQDIPIDFVIATGETHSVRDFVMEAFKNIGIDKWESYVIINEKYKRPLEVPYLRGDASLAHSLLDWRPTITFKELVKEMVQADLERLNHGQETKVIS